MRSRWRSSFNRVFLGLLGLVAGAVLHLTTAEVGAETSCAFRPYECEAPFIVMGPVRQPGTYDYQPALTVGELLSIAGGVTSAADTDQIVIQRRQGARFIMVKASTRHLVEAGDIVTVLRDRPRQPAQAAQIQATASVESGRVPVPVTQQPVTVSPPPQAAPAEPEPEAGLDQRLKAMEELIRNGQQFTGRIQQLARSAPDASVAAKPPAEQPTLSARTVPAAPVEVEARPEEPTPLNSLPPSGAVPHDMVKVRVYDHPDLTVDSRVRPDGTITFPLLGTIQVAGATAPQLERLITDLLVEGGYLVNPQVSVQIEKAPMFVTGQVARPGAYPYEFGLTVEKLLALAGGLTEKARTDRIRIERQVQGRLLILEAGLPDPVLPGDVVTVTESQLFFINGQVGRPGAYPYQEGLTVEKAIILAGGPTEKGQTTAVRLRRQGGATPAGLEVGSQEPIRPGDILTVPEKQMFFVLGEVKRPGTYLYEPGLTVSKAITSAGGPSDKAATGRTRITRTGPDGKESTSRAKPEDLVKPDDVVIVPESLF